MRRLPSPPIEGPSPAAGVRASCSRRPRLTAAATLPELLSVADRNLYVAKHAGRDRVVCESNADTPRRYRDAPPPGGAASRGEGVPWEIVSCRT